MADDNKVVIKINYQGRGKAIKKNSQPNMVTEWNVQRILVAVLLLIIFILIPFYYFIDDSSVSGSSSENRTTLNISNKTLDPVIKSSKKIIENEKLVSVFNPIENIKKVKIKPVEIESPSLVSDDARIVRALLTSELNNREPINTIDSLVSVNKEQATRIYYFTEISDMKGQTLFHHWVWNEQVIFKRKITILGNRWRAATSKLIPYSKAGIWNVRLVSKESFILNNIEFEVIQE